MMGCGVMRVIPYAVGCRWSVVGGRVVGGRVVGGRWSVVGGRWSVVVAGASSRLAGGRSVGASERRWWTDLSVARVGEDGR